MPLAGLTVLGTLSLDTGNFRHVFIYGGMYAVAWLVYLVVLNERPHLLVPIAAVLFIQGAVAAGQFLAQRDLGLVPLGELPLHPAHEGNSVLLARGQPWLRAYGLTIHPNLLGALLAALLLLALPMARRGRGAEPVSYTHLDVYKRQVHSNNWYLETVVSVGIVGAAPFFLWLACLLYTSRCV